MSIDKIYFHIFQAKIKTIKLTIAVILGYILCSAPFIVAQIWGVFGTIPQILGKTTYIICDQRFKISSEKRTRSCVLYQILFSNNLN